MKKQKNADLKKPIVAQTQPIDYKIATHSSCCIIPPQEIWDSIQEVRYEYDKSVSRWPPHINLLFPFIAASHFDQVEASVAKLLSQVQPFKVRLDHFEFHSTSNTSKYMYLKPIVITGADDLLVQQQVKQVKNPSKKKDAQAAIPVDPLIKIQSLLSSHFPQCSDQSKQYSNGYYAHMTVGQVDQEKGQEICDKLNQNWKPIEFNVNSIQFIAREGQESPFKVVKTIEIGKN